MTNAMTGTDLIIIGLGLSAIVAAIVLGLNAWFDSRRRRRIGRRNETTASVFRRSRRAELLRKLEQAGRRQ